MPEKGIKPDNIPSDPRKIYKSKGWINLYDWLGKNMFKLTMKSY